MPLASWSIPVPVILKEQQRLPWASWYAFIDQDMLLLLKTFFESIAIKFSSILCLSPLWDINGQDWLSTSIIWLDKNKISIYWAVIVNASFKRVCVVPGQIWFSVWISSLTTSGQKTLSCLLQIFLPRYFFTHDKCTFLGEKLSSQY